MKKKPVIHDTCSEISEQHISEIKLPSVFYDWYKKQKRDLPFRDTGNFYHTWISEVMLQQTRVAAMTESYINFIKVFPGLKELAASSEEEVLAMWKGLGYYSRARNLRKAALYVMEKFDGNFPADFNQAKTIPGIGDYTAGAVLSIGLGLEFPVVDGNVKRFLSRYFYRKSIAENPDYLKDPESTSAELFHFSDMKILSSSSLSLLSKIILKNRNHHRKSGKNQISPGDHNQAIMEFGALVCTPKNPQCSICVVKESCAGYTEGGQRLVSEIPPKKITEKKDVRLIVHILQHGEDVLIVKDTSSLFFKSDWFFPHEIYIKRKHNLINKKYKEEASIRSNEYFFHHSTDLHSEKQEISSGNTGNARDEYRLFSELNYAVSESGSELSHTITSHRIKVLPVFHRIKKTVLLRSGSVKFQWIKKSDLHNTVISSLAYKITSSEKREN
jgi:A/G-specific adenine glycosylase